MELAVPAWHGSITQFERHDIERVQKGALHIILGDRYESYKDALKFSNLDSLEKRRDKLCLNMQRRLKKMLNIKIGSR